MKFTMRFEGEMSLKFTCLSFYGSSFILNSSEKVIGFQFLVNIRNSNKYF